MPMDPKTQWYSQNDKTPGCIVLTAAVLSILGAAGTLWVVYDAWTNKHIVPLYIAIGCWAVVPPFWFWLEYFCVYRVYGQPDTFELFKYGLAGVNYLERSCRRVTLVVIHHERRPG